MAKKGVIGLVVMFLVLVTSRMIRSEIHQERILNSIPRKFTVYFQLITEGSNASLVPVAGLPNRTGSLTEFGNVFTGGVLGTEGVRINSPEVGRTQGLIVVSSMDATRLYYSYSITFSAGNCRGSTLQLQGVSDSGLDGELSIGSGTNCYRFARGYALFQTLLQNPATNNTLVKADIYVKFDHI